MGNAIKEMLVEYKERLMTGFILLFASLLVLFSDNLFIIWLIVGVAYLISFYEALKLFEIEENYLYVVSLFLWIGAFFYADATDFIMLLLIVLASFISFGAKVDDKLVLPILYPTLPFLAIIEIYQNFGIDSLLWLISIVATVDIAAFFVGKNIGSRQFSETSPNKTVEGVVGGIIIGMIVGSFVGTLLLPFVYSVVCSLVISIASIFGDLFESYLKRNADKKDSGNILPGHGGVLDRVDGYLFAAPFMMICLKIFATNQ